MDRQQVFLGQVPLETDLLNTERYAMIGLGYALQGYLGTTTIVDGFTCIPTVPASLNVIVTAGQVLSQQNVDNSAFSSLPADTTHQIIKQGLLLNPATFTLAAPTATGFSVNYLIEVAQEDIDNNPVVLPYFNPANPTNAFTGPAGSGSTNNTVRQSLAVVQVKAGVAAASGSQVTPTVDGGFSPLFVITVSFGATTITSANISTHPSAPFIDVGSKLPQAPFSFQNGQWTWAAVFGGTTTAVTATLQPGPLSYVAGLKVRGNIATTTTGATTLNVNGLGARPIVRLDGSGTLGGELNAGQMAEFTYNGTSFVITSGPTSSTFVPVVPTTTWFVDATAGSDVIGNGIGPGSNAFRTGQFAVNTISKYFSSGPVTVNFATGTYAGFSFVPSLISSWILVGSGVSTCSISSPTIATNTGRGVILASQTVIVSNFTITSFYEGIVPNVAGSLTISGCNFVGVGASTSVAVASYGGSSCLVHGSIGISGTYNACFAVQTSGSLAIGYHDLSNSLPATVTFGSTTTASGTVIAISDSAVTIVSSVVTFAGSTPTGLRFQTNTGGGINVEGGGASFIPGTIAGTATAPGWFAP